MKKKLIIGVAVLVLLALVAMRLLKPQEKEVAASVPVVTTQNPATDSIYLKTGLTGSIEPADIVYVIPKAAGEITEVSVKAGDMVEEGQKLVLRGKGKAIYEGTSGKSRKGKDYIRVTKDI